MVLSTVDLVVMDGLGGDLMHRHTHTGIHTQRKGVRQEDQKRSRGGNRGHVGCEWVVSTDFLAKPSMGPSPKLWGLHVGMSEPLERRGRPFFRASLRVAGWPGGGGSVIFYGLEVTE